MWTSEFSPNCLEVADTNAVPVAAEFPPLPKLKPHTPWPKPTAQVPILTELPIADTITQKRTFLVADSERAIASIYKEVEDDWREFVANTDPFEARNFICVSVKLLAKLFECIDTRNIPD